MTASFSLFYDEASFQRPAAVLYIFQGTRVTSDMSTCWGRLNRQHSRVLRPHGISRIPSSALQHLRQYEKGRDEVIWWHLIAKHSDRGICKPQKSRRKDRNRIDFRSLYPGRAEGRVVGVEGEEGIGRGVIRG